MNVVHNVDLNWNMTRSSREFCWLYERRHSAFLSKHTDNRRKNVTERPTLELDGRNSFQKENWNNDGMK